MSIAAMDTLTIALDNRPPSTQSTRDAKAAFAAVVARRLNDFPFVLVDDVSLVVQWHCTLEARYESDKLADVDNILKPLLDSLVDTKVLLDDSVVQAVQCSWIDHTRSTDGLVVSLSSVYSNDLRRCAIPRSALVCIEVLPNLFFPFNTSLPAELRVACVTAVVRMCETRERLKANGISHVEASLALPAQRLFHRSRVQNWPRLTWQEYLQKCQDEM